MLGYGGHFLTKSRRYSVTFGQLRTARADHRRATATPDGTRPLGPPARRDRRPGPQHHLDLRRDRLPAAAAQLALAPATPARDH